MIMISDLYRTGIRCSSYNVDIDTTEIKVTVQYVDFNDNPVPDKYVSLSVDKGEFTSILSDRQDVGMSSNHKVVTGYTDNEGEFSAYYTASEWGLATFNANTANISINVKGWRTVVNNQNGITIRTDGILGDLIVSKEAFNIPKGATLLTTISSTYIPDKVFTMFGHHNKTTNLTVTFMESGEIHVRNYTGEVLAGQSLHCGRVYRLRTPLY